MLRPSYSSGPLWVFAFSVCLAAVLLKVFVLEGALALDEPVKAGVL